MSARAVVGMFFLIFGIVTGGFNLAIFIADGTLINLIGGTGGLIAAVCGMSMVDDR